MTISFLITERSKYLAQTDTDHHDKPKMIRHDSGDRDEKTNQTEQQWND